jgi:hypothetical protein
VRITDGMVQPVRRVNSICILSPGLLCGASFRPQRRGLSCLGAEF